MATIRSYRELKVWQLAEEVFRMVCEDVKKFPNHKIAWIITDQLVRSAGSIGANIAEGFSRKTKNEIIQFFSISRGSTSETEVWILQTENEKLITKERIDSYFDKLDSIQKMINAFISKLRSSTFTH